MATRRQRQVAELIHVEISTLIQTRARDPRLAVVTITGVDVTPDLKEAQVFFSVLGDGEAKAEALHGLQSAAGFLRRELGNTLSLRVTPTLTFRLDESAERGIKIDSLLESVLPPDDDQQDEVGE